jgi:hypothetical protein
VEIKIFSRHYKIHRGIGRSSRNVVVRDSHTFVNQQRQCNSPNVKVKRRGKFPHPLRGAHTLRRHWVHRLFAAADEPLNKHWKYSYTLPGHFLLPVALRAVTAPPVRIRTGFTKRVPLDDGFAYFQRTGGQDREIPLKCLMGVSPRFIRTVSVYLASASARWRNCSSVGLLVGSDYGIA